MIRLIAVSTIGPARRSLWSCAEPIDSACLGVALLGEALTLMQFGAIILMVGAFAAACSSSRSPGRA